MSPVRPARSAGQQRREELLPQAAADRRLGALQAGLAAGPADRVAQVYERTVICTPGQGQFPGQKPAGQQWRATAQRGWRDADDHLIEQAMVGELTNKIAAADQPDIAPACRSPHLLVHGAHVA